METTHTTLTLSLKIRLETGGRGLSGSVPEIVRQRHLLEALLGDPAVFLQFVRMLLVSELADLSREDWIRLIASKQPVLDEEILAPVLARLPAVDQAELTAFISLDRLLDANEEFFNSFRIEIAEAELTME
jgi:hypothetical protein